MQINAQSLGSIVKEESVSGYLPAYRIEG